jgi:outer membrane protein TolC
MSGIHGLLGSGVWIACLLLAGSALASPDPADQSLDALDALLVGDIAEVDLELVRQLTTGTDPEVANVRAARPVAEGAIPIGLQAAVEVALLNNLDLQIARAERDAAVHEVPATRAKFHPTTGLAVGARGSNLAGDSGAQEALAFLRQEVPTGGSLTLSSDFSQTDVGSSSFLRERGVELEMRQPLMRGGRSYVSRREILDAGYDFQVEDARLQAEILRITRNAKVAYYDTILADRLIDVTEAAVERDKQLIEASKALFRAARASSRDVVSAQIRLSDDLAQLASRRARLREARLELRDVLGLPLAQLVHPAEESVPFDPVAVQPDEWVARALRDGPEIRELRSRLEQVGLQVRISGNEVLPKLDALGLYRRRDTGGGLSRTFDLGNESWSVGLEFEIPFANVAARERLAGARIEYLRSERELERQMREIEREVRTQVIELRRGLVEVSVQADKVESSREKLAVAVARYRLGIANNLDITDGQEDLLNAETDFLTAIFDYTNDLVRLEASIGGPI